MALGILGKKLGMTQVFREDGKSEAVTVIEAGPCTVVQVKTDDKEGYNSAQLGFGQARKLKSPQRGHMKEMGEFKYLREFRVDDIKDVELGQKVDAGMFQSGDLVDITGVSKGKGFAGGVKRYHFRGGPKTHGQSDRHRAPGSVGAGTSPGRVFKGLHMAGHMGNRQVTARNLEVYQADAERNLLLVRGAVPGGRNGMVIIRKSAGSK